MISSNYWLHLSQRSILVSPVLLNFDWDDFRYLELLWIYSTLSTFIPLKRQLGTTLTTTLGDNTIFVIWFALLTCTRTICCSLLHYCYNQYIFKMDKKSYVLLNLQRKINLRRISSKLFLSFYYFWLSNKKGYMSKVMITIKQDSMLINKLQITPIFKSRFLRKSWFLD